MKIIFVFLFSLLINSHAWSEVSFEHAPQIFKDSKVEEYSPMWGMVLLKSGVLKNIRLFGNYNSSIVENTKRVDGKDVKLLQCNTPFPLHNALKGANLKNNCPADGVASFIQHLFPSVDGALLTHNERKNDPWGIIASKIVTEDKDKALEIINKILEAIINYKNNNITNHETLIAATANLKTALETAFKEGGIILSQKQDKSNDDYVKPNFLTSNIDSIITALESEEEDFNKGDNNRIYPRNIVIHALLAFAWKIADNPDDIYNLTAVMKENSTLSSSKSKEDYIEDYNKYKKEFIEKIKKEELKEIEDNQGANLVVNPEEIAFFTQGYVAYERPIPDLIQYKTTNFKGHSYSDCGETSLLNLFYILKGEQSIDTIEGKLNQHENEIPEDLPAPQKESVELISVIQIDNNLKEFFKKYPSISTGNTALSHEAWSNVVSNLNTSYYKGDNSVLYKNEIKEISQNSVHLGQYELLGRGGIINMLSVIGKLIPDPDLAAKSKEDEDNQITEAEPTTNKFDFTKVSLKQITEKLNRLCRLFSDKKTVWTWNCDNIKENTAIKIIFQKNYEDAFIWDIQPMHFNIEPMVDLKSDWRKSISFTNDNFKKYDLLQAWFINELDINGLERDEIKPYHLWGLNMSDMTVAAKTINFILEKNTKKETEIIEKKPETEIAEKEEVMAENGWQRFYPMIPIMIDKSIPVEDEAARSVLKPIIYYYSNIFKESIFKEAIPESITKAFQGFLYDKVEKVPTGAMFNVAVENGYTNIISINPITRQQGNLTTPYYGYKSPIHIAVEKNYYNIVEQLFKKNSKILEWHNDNQNQLYPIVFAGNKKMIELLCNKNSNLIDYKDPQGVTNLMRAAKIGDYEMVYFVIKQKGFVDDKDKSGYKVFHYAVEREGTDTEILDLLLKEGANPRAVSNSGYNPADIANRQSNIKALEWLTENGVFPEQGNDDDEDNSYGD